MKPRLAELQERMQQSILSRDGKMLPLIRPMTGDSPSIMFGVYENAYLLRLTEFLENDHVSLRTYLGDVTFRDMARAYAAVHPSSTPNARWFSRHLPDFLASSAAYRDHPELSEFARLEKALNDAFDAVDAPHATLADLAKLDASKFEQLRFSLHPSANRFTFRTNVTSIWSSLKCSEIPPKPELLSRPMQLLVWRQGSSSRFRILGEEEAMAIDQCRVAVSFGVICEMMAFMQGANSAAQRAAGYLRGWIETELIESISQ